jgi:hypothetical protein
MSVVPEVVLTRVFRSALLVKVGTTFPTPQFTPPFSPQFNDTEVYVHQMNIKTKMV